MPPIDPKTARAELDRAIRAEADPTAPRVKKFLLVKQLFAKITDLPEGETPAVYISKPSNTGARVGQSKVTRFRKLIVGIINEEPAEGFEKLETYEAQARQVVGERTVEAMVLCGLERRDGQWKVLSVVERAPAPLAKKIAASFPGIKTIFPMTEIEDEEEDEGGSISLPPADPSDLADTLFIDQSWIEDVLWMLRDKHALVLYGPPGTGKTYIAQKIAAHLQPDVSRRALVQLHPSYGYEDFFEGFRPKVVDGKPALDKQSGPLRELSKLAADHPNQPVVLVLDEMNRGNLPRIFGELFFLLEYREASVRLMYSPDEQFRLPQNLFIIGTMNTADRSIALLDQALRRRFHFAGLFPDAPPGSGMLRKFLKEHRPEMEWVADLLVEANRRLGDRNAAIGPSHLMRKDLDEQILPSIEEHFFGQQSKLVQFDLEDLMRSVGHGSAGGSPTSSS